MDTYVIRHFVANGQINGNDNPFLELCGFHNLMVGDYGVQVVPVAIK